MKLNDEPASIYKDIFLKLDNLILPSHLEWFNKKYIIILCRISYLMALTKNP